MQILHNCILGTSVPIYLSLGDPWNQCPVIQRNDLNIFLK